MEATLGPDEPGRDTHEEARSQRPQINDLRRRKPEGFDGGGRVVALGIGKEEDGEEGEGDGDGDCES